MILIGNNLAASLTQKTLNSGLHPVLLTGPDGIGKFSYLENLLAGDTVYVTSGEEGIDSVRKAISESCTSSLWSKNSICIIRDIEKYSDPAKDFLLKYLEEPGNNVKYYAICSDSGLMNEALLSRFRVRIDWIPIKNKELLEHSKDELAAEIARGSFATFLSCSGDSKFLELYNILKKPDWPSIALTSPPPILFDGWKTATPSRKTAIANLFWYAARRSKHSSSFLKLSNVIRQPVSININNYYWSMAAESL
jgi:DNA polymerase III, delta subunit